MKTMDGNTAAAYVSYAFTEVAGIYPITPSSNMAEAVDEWSAEGKTNMFGQRVNVVEMQSEAGAAGTVHGSLQAGALTTTYTASQGLLLMIPNMYKIAGELLPCVIHVSARAVAGHALSIFGDHSDVMAVRQTGFALLASSNVQEAMDLAAVSHLATLTARVPFLHFFDGFRTSHELQRIGILDYDDLYEITDHEAIRKFRANALNPEHPVVRGTAQNPDVFFQAKEASNPYYNAVPAIVEDYMEKVNKIAGTDYKLFNYYGAPDADRVIIAMGSACDAIKETIDYMLAKGEKVGLVNVHLYRPFSVKHFLSAIPTTATKIAVLDRNKEPGSLGEPLYQDVCTAFYEEGKYPTIVAGRYGLGSKDVTPAQVIAVYENLKQATPKNHFTVGINDDVTNLSIPVGKEIDITPEGTVSCKIWGLGGDGTVSANQNSIKIIGEEADMYAQAYFAYDSKKSMGVTTSHLRFGKTPIRSTYLVKTADFVACHPQSYVGKYAMLADLKEGGTFLLNTQWKESDLEQNLPNDFKKELAQKNIKFYIIDGYEIAQEAGLGKRINTVLQAAFFKLINVIPVDEAIKHMKDAIKETFSKKGEAVVNMNFAAVDNALAGLKEIKVPASWKDLPSDKINLDELPHIKNNDKTDREFIKNVVFPINEQRGEVLPVSAFSGIEDGTFPLGTSAYEKRGIAINVPKWLPEKCIQCNLCAYVCPHATIRPFLLTEEENAKKSDTFDTIKANGKGLEDLHFSIQITCLDCPGCTSCAKVCPTDALEMVPQESEWHKMDDWYAALKLSNKEEIAKNSAFKPETVKGSQFLQPMLEFSGACIGCGETPYAKLLTQLFGDRMYIANATGCSSIWGASAPSTPYTTNHKGQGPAWANSLFEDTAEFGFGLHLGISHRRNELKDVLTEVMNSNLASPELKTAAKEWIDAKEDSKLSPVASDKLRAAINGVNSPDKDFNKLIQHIKNNDDALVKKSTWIFGGDGWAYDIGYGGLDHVISTGENVNIFVFDTEVYSNTGGQSSKATPTAAIAKFAASGKKSRKKDLGFMAMNYGNVYVAQIGMGANTNQTIKAITEAEAYDGPSVIIAYAPCIAQGIDMSDTQAHTKRAVEAGYWHLYRFNPLLKAEGKNPFILDSKPPSASFADFLNSEARYTALKINFPELADELFEKAAQDAKERFESYRKMAVESIF